MIVLWRVELKQLTGGLCIIIGSGRVNLGVGGNLNSFLIFKIRCVPSSFAINLICGFGREIMDIISPLSY